MAKKAEEKVNPNAELLAQIEALTRENAALKAANKPVEAAPKKEEAKGVTVQHVRPMRQWTVLRSRVLKVHRGTGTINSPRFAKNIVLTPGCVVTVEPQLAKDLIKSKDFQKYGIEK